jgi:hypothetical protein
VQTKEKKMSITDDQLFSTNVAKGQIKEKREKLKADRFKPVQYNQPKVDAKIIKRNLEKMERKAVAPKQQIDKPKKSDDFGGDLEDIWGSDGRTIVEVDRSHHMKKFKEGFAKKDRVIVKAVINPIGGLSYNPSMKDHKSLLIEVAKKEEEIVAENLKDLKRTRPLLYKATQGEVSDEDEEPVREQQESSESEDSEDIDPEKPLGINKAVDRLGLKTQTQRNKEALTRAKVQAIKAEKEKRKFEKDLERLDNLVKQD